MSILFSQFSVQNNQIRPQESGFTEVLSHIAVVPKMLYFYGKIPEKRSLPVVAIVGSRKPTEYGKQIAYDLAFAVAKRGGIVVSGLAYGIDSIAHRAALDAGGITLAILGTPIDKIYPVGHMGLAGEIIERGGAVMSEINRGEDFYPQTSFLERNRLISGLADVVVIPEAAERSGSLNTAAHALEQGKEIFAVPGDINREMSRGCNRLIAKGGAAIYTGKDDVMEVLFPEDYRRRRKSRRETLQTSLFGDNEIETTILRALGNGMRQAEEIIERYQIAVEDFNRSITMLEIKDRVMALGMNNWALKE